MEVVPLYIPSLYSKYRTVQYGDVEPITHLSLDDALQIISTIQEEKSPPYMYENYPLYSNYEMTSIKRGG